MRRTKKDDETKPLKTTDDFLRAVAKGLDDVLNPGWDKGKEKRIGFALVTYNFGEHIGGTGRVNYIGNTASRDDVFIALKELMARWEARYQETGTTKPQ